MPCDANLKVTAMEALKRLMDGNTRMCEGGRSVPYDTEKVPLLDDNGQNPFATVISCSDSRVPPELVFGCGLGEIFVIRTAGNVVSSFEIGSVEYAAAHLHTPLILVLGHSHCGAVAAAADGKEVGGCLESIMSEIAASVEEAGKGVEDRLAVISAAEDLNIRHTVSLLKENMVLQSIPDLLIQGAKYDTHSGRVRLLD